MLVPAIRSFDRGIHAIDTGFVRPGLAASYLVVRDGRAAFVDCGTSRSVPALLAALDGLGLSLAAVEYVILTHVHLDHAGGAGALLAALPGAIAVVHPRGAPHLADPARLEAASRAVYGDAAYDALYGPLEPIPRARIRAVADGEALLLGGTRLVLVDTPGHALHHVAVHDEATAAVFAGDAFGISYRIFDDPAGAPYLFATTSPSQFDPAQSHSSIERILALAPTSVYLGHFGPVGGVDRLADALHRDIDRFAALASAAAGTGGGGDPEAEAALARAILDHLTAGLAAHNPRVDRATARSWLTMDAELNAAGLLAWQARLRKGS
jgi:glyoxylase-like metal-dependent hydrolase (beta-lactamase superfamily II)